MRYISLSTILLYLPSGCLSGHLCWKHLPLTIQNYHRCMLNFAQMCMYIIPINREPHVYKYGTFHLAFLALLYDLAWNADTAHSFKFMGKVCWCTIPTYMYRHAADCCALTTWCTYWCGWWLHLWNQCACSRLFCFYLQIGRLVCFPAKVNKIWTLSAVLILTWRLV